MKHYYIVDHTAERGFIELSESEFYSIVGDDEISPYAAEVYRGTLSIDEVPADLRDSVRTVVNNRIARFGEYNKQEIPANELKSMVEGVV